MSETIAVTDDDLASGAVVVPIIEETLKVERQEVARGGVRVTKTVHEYDEMVDEPIVEDRADVERTPIGRFIDAIPAVRYEDGVTVIPVVEEVAVISKRLRLVEEIRIVETRTTRQDPQTIPLLREEVVIERFEDE